jgi:diguanylate cyclase (GGDEF)-like protein
MIINITFNIRNYGYKSVEQKAQLVAQTVKLGLTFYMINGVIDKRAIFLEQITNLDNIEKLWLVRSNSVIKQYGLGLQDELAKDDIDKDVLQSGKTIKDINEKFLGNSTFRITIPYKAQTTGAINCTSCHNAKDGDTLGAITIVMNINDLKEEGINTIFATAMIAFILIMVILFFVNRLIDPYMSIFYSIKHVMQQAKDGDYSHRINNKSTIQNKEVANSINIVLDKLQNTLLDINSKVTKFLTNDKTQNDDPLIEVQSTVSRLADVYRFRQTIEHDESIEEVYGRIINVLTSKFNLDDFNFIEANTTKKETEVVYIHKKLYCDAHKGCRADKTNSIVDSCQFKNLCDKVVDNSMHYLCIPYSISNDMDFIININLKTKEELAKVREQLPQIKDYIESAKPEIVSKKLMQVLERSARTDSLTGLYNRKYLEESIEQIVQQSKRTKISYGVLMVDIDYFKMVNDTYGHDVGDEAIRIIANTLVENTRDSDIVIRYGGEEFVVLLYNCDSQYVIKVAQNIREAFSKRKINAGSTNFSKTISIGASIFPDTAESFWQCIKYADMALYHAKETGRNKVVLFDKSLLKDDDINDKSY